MSAALLVGLWAGERFLRWVPDEPIKLGERYLVEVGRQVYIYIIYIHESHRGPRRDVGGGGGL